MKGAGEGWPLPSLGAAEQRFGSPSESTAGSSERLCACRCRESGELLDVVLASGHGFRKLLWCSLVAFCFAAFAYGVASNVRMKSEMGACECGCRKDVTPMDRVFADPWSPSSLCWTFLFVFCVAALAVGIFIEAMYYMKDTTASRMTLHHIDRVVLPDVAVCSAIPLNVSRLVDDGFTQRQIIGFHANFQEVQYKAVMGWPVYGEAAQQGDRVPDYVDWGQFVANYSIRCEDFFAGCMARQNPFNCCAVAEPVFHEKFGRCFVFRKFEQGDENHMSSLTVIVKNGGLIPDDISSAMSMPAERGIVAEIGDNYQPPYANGAHQQLSFQADSLTLVELKRTEYIRDERSGCEVAATKDAGFSKGRCKKDCFGGLLAWFCNCTVLGYRHMPEQPWICRPQQLSECWSLRGDNQRTHKMDADVDECFFSKCQIPCKQSFYTISTTDAGLNSAPLVKARRRIGLEEPRGVNDTSEEVKLTKVIVYFKDLVFTRIEEFETLTFQNVLSSLGGQLGLYLGASLISIVHFVVSVVDRAREAWAGRSRRAKVLSISTKANSASSTSSRLSSPS